MADTDTLTIKVDTSQVESAIQALNDLAAAAERVQALMSKPITITLTDPVALDVGDMFERLNAEAKAGGLTIT